MTSSLPTRLRDGELAVDTRGLTKRFGDQVALNDVTLQVPTGAVYLLVGPNGAGKSTTLKVLLDLVRAEQGTADVFGLDTRQRAPEVRANVGYVPERPDWGYGWMRVGRLLEHHALYYPTWDQTYAAKLAQKFELRMDRKMGVLSKGQARRVHLTMALAHRPPLLLLDEPTDGLDPFMRDETLGVIADHLAESPTTVVLSTHHVEEVEGLADHIGVLRNGELRAQMSRDDLNANLRRYRVEVPDGWSGVASLNGTVLRRVTTPREVQ
jgi:ABC-2 type transport system ATP-binding protein